MYLLSDELNNLANLKNPLSEDEVIVHEKKVDELNTLRAKINELNKIIEVNSLHLFLIIYILILVFFTLNNSQIDIGGVLFSLVLTIPIWIYSSVIHFNGVNVSQIFQYSEVKSAQETRSLLYEKINILNKNIAEIETKIFNYYTNQLEMFFNNYLYKKRATNIKFKIALSTFSKVIDSLEELNKSIITPQFKIELRYYKNYILGREINSGSYSSVSKSNSKDVLANKSDDEKRTNTTTVYGDSKTPDISHVASVLNNIEPPKPLPPEHKYKKSGQINDWDLINKSRQEIGLEGEQIVVMVEKYYLRSIGRQDLADKVRHIAREDGDGFGYDVLSFFENGTQKYIEVKSTKQNIHNPFYMSENELSFLKQNNTEAFIYRVLVDKEAPRLKVYSSYDVFNSHDITPSQYKVKLKSF
jgi:hypothetical protein